MAVSARCHATGGISSEAEVGKVGIGVEVQGPGRACSAAYGEVAFEVVQPKLLGKAAQRGRRCKRRSSQGDGKRERERVDFVFSACARVCFCTCRKQAGRAEAQKTVKLLYTLGEACQDPRPLLASRRVYREQRGPLQLAGRKSKTCAIVVR